MMTGIFGQQVYVANDHDERDDSVTGNETGERSMPEIVAALSR